MYSAVLTSVLFVLHWLVFQAHAPPHRSTMLYCDNESALEAVFTPLRVTNNPYVFLAPDIDLIQLCQTLLASLPPIIIVKHSWVKGHYKGATDVSSHRASAKSLLETSVLSNTPNLLTKMLLHGLDQWENMENTTTSPTPFLRGTVIPTEVALLQAFQSQSSIGWDHLLRGRLSKHWEQVYTLINTLRRYPSDNLGNNSDCTYMDLLYIPLEVP